MAKEAFEKIKAAEDEAARIKTAAVAKTRELTAQATSDGEKRFEESSREAAVRYESKIKAVKAEADQIIASGKRLADERAEALVAKAKKKLPACVDAIIAGITG
jgi:hypothetical protein